jgi:hypothetical protein
MPPAAHHCTGIPKSKGERSNPNKRTGKEITAKNDPRKWVKASAAIVRLDEDKQDNPVYRLCL